MISRNGTPVWSCMYCHFLHSEESAKYVHDRLNADGIDDEAGLKALFDEVKGLFFHSRREHRIELAERQRG